MKRKLTDLPVTPPEAEKENAEKKRLRLRLEKTLFLDLCLLSLAAALLLVHLMVIRSPALLAVGLVLLVGVASVSLFEHLVFFRRPAQRPTLPMPSWGYLIFFAIVGFFLVGPVLVSCVTGAGIGALVAWWRGSDVSDAGWRGFFVGFFWCLALFAYAAMKLGLVFLQVRPRFPAEPPEPAEPSGSGQGPGGPAPIVS